MKLQRGRRSSRRIGPKRRRLAWSRRGFNEAAVHLGGSERGGVLIHEIVSCFNEAAVHHGGSEYLEMTQWLVFCMLQRGRRSSRRIGRLSQPVVGSKLDASTRPPFISADRSLKAQSHESTTKSLQRGRRSSRRIGWQYITIAGVSGMLQRGRRSSRRIGSRVVVFRLRA